MAVAATARLVSSLVLLRIGRVLASAAVGDDDRADDA
jgi:hypothetical protein